MKIRAIPTLYNDLLFRSRLEAQWAYLLDLCAIRWVYEPQVYTFEDGSRYIPDFYLPAANMWLEIKGAPLSGVDYLKIKNLVHFLGAPVVLLDRNPALGIYDYVGLEQGSDLFIRSERSSELEYTTCDEGTDNYYKHPSLELHLGEVSLSSLVNFTTQAGTPLSDELLREFAKDAKNAFRFSPINENKPHDISLKHPNPKLLGKMELVSNINSIAIPPAD
jgi:hypothetical protein